MSRCPWPPGCHRRTASLAGAFVAALCLSFAPELRLPVGVVAVAAPALPVFLIVARLETGQLVSGTCFYLRRPSSTWIVTANHIVEGADPAKIAVRVGSGFVPLTLMRQDPSTDLAALRSEAPIPVAPLLLRAASAEQGEVVSISGFPIPDVLGISSLTTVRGPVTGYSATPGGIPGFFIEAPASHGDSGAPVLDTQGRVLGVVVYATDDGSTAYAVHGFQILKLLGEGGP